MVHVMQGSEDKFSSLGHQMGKWVDQVLGPGYQRYSTSKGWSPPVNVYESETQYSLVVDLAGVSIEDVLRVEKGMLVIAGTRETPGLEQLEGSVRVHHMEIDHGLFQRKLEIPGDVDTDRIEASYRMGLLWIRMPKKG